MVLHERDVAMKRCSKILKTMFVCCALMLLLPTVVMADLKVTYGDYPIAGGNLRFKRTHYYNGDIDITIIDCDDDVSSVYIPDTIEGEWVVAIGSGAFSGSSIRSVRIPDSVTSIGDYAFSSCVNLGSIRIPEGVISVGEYAFSGCTSLQRVDIPNSMLGIGGYAFQGCQNLRSAHISSDINYGSGVYAYCTNLESVYIEDGVTEISYDMFRNCENLKRIALPDSVEWIYDRAFQQCYSLEHITTSKNLKLIGEDAFYSCSLKKIDLPEGLTEIGYRAFYNNRFEQIRIPDSLDISGMSTNVFESCSFLQDVQWGKGMTYIPERTFYDCYYLNHVTGLDHVTGIGEYAFGGCYHLTEIDLSSNVREVRMYPYAFANSGLTRIRIPPCDNVCTIYSDAFSGCQELREVILPPCVTYVQNRAFYGCGNLSVFYIECRESDWHYPFEAGALPEELWTETCEIQFIFLDSQPQVILPDSCCICVKDMKGNPLSNASVTLDGETFLSDVNGNVFFTMSENKATYLAVSLEGYYPWSSESLYNWSLSENGYECVFLCPLGGMECQLYSVRYHNSTSILPDCDLLVQTKRLNQTDQNNWMMGLDFGHFDLYCAATTPDKITRYELWQGENKVSECLNGNFLDLAINSFQTEGDCYIRIITKDGEKIDARINLEFQETQLNEETAILLGENDLSIEISDDVPFFGGSTLELSLPEVPLTASITDTKIHFGINMKAFDDKTVYRDYAKSVQEIQEALDRLGNVNRIIGIGKKDAERFKSFMRKSNYVKLPGGEFEANVIGYMEYDTQSNQTTGQLYLLIETQTPKFGYTTWVVAVPVTVHVQAGLEGQVGGTVIYDWKKEQFDSGIDYNLGVELSAFGGVGIGNITGVGAYGSAEVQVDGRLLGIASGVEKVELTGELGIQVYAGIFDYKKAFLYQTWSLYERSMADTYQLFLDVAPSLAQELGDASLYEVHDLSYLSEESEWDGTASTGAIKNHGYLDPVLSNTYQNAQPVMISSGDALYAAFLRADTDTGSIYAACTRYDGTEWAQPVPAGENAIADDAPVLCMDESGTIWLAYARTNEETGTSLLTYAQNQSIVVGSLDSDTLEFTEMASYPGSGYAHTHKLSIVNGTPILVWADSVVTDESSVLLPQSSIVYYAVYENGAWGNAQKLIVLDKPLLDLEVGVHNDDWSIACLLLENDTQNLYTVSSNGTKTLLSENVMGDVSFGTLPGQSTGEFMWNGQGVLATSTNQIVIPGITNHYAVLNNRVYFSAVSGNSTDLMMIQYQEGTWSAPVQLINGTRYLEYLSVASMGGNDYVFGMYTSVHLTEDSAVDVVKDLVWYRVMPVSDLILEDVFYTSDIELVPGEDVSVSVLVANAGDHTVTGVDITINETSITEECEIIPGGSQTFTMTLACPETATEYVVEICESYEDDFTPEDNKRTLTLGSADLAVELAFQQVRGSKSLIATVSNQGIDKTGGTIRFYDAEDNLISINDLPALNGNESCVVVSDLKPEMNGFHDGVFHVEVICDTEELYIYNNEASIYLPEAFTAITYASQIGNIVSAQVSSVETGNTLYCASYDTDGKLIETFIKALEVGHNNVDFILTKESGTSNVKLFVLNKQFAPVCSEWCTN